jgi:outer membrane receptor protein involved in Fe transport
MVAQANANVPGVTGKVTTLLPKAGILIDWSDTLSSAFVVQRGYRPGGVSINIARGRAVAYDPEYLWNAELSLRARLAGGRLQLGANAYYAKWRNQQVSVNFGLNSFDTNTVNAARSHINGMEIEATYQANKAWSLFASAGHTRTRFDGFDGGQAGSVSDLPGTEFAFAPRWTMSSGTQLRLTSGIAGALSVSHSSRSFAAVGSRQSDYAVKAHSSVDARLGYEGDHWSAFVAAHNLFDETYIVYKSPGETRAILSAPRRVMVELRSEY